MVTGSESWVWVWGTGEGRQLCGQAEEQEGKPIHSQALIRRVLPSDSLGKAMGSAAIKE